MKWVKIINPEPDKAHGLKIYWGVEPDSSFSIKYLIPLWCLAEFMAQGYFATILIADIHTYLRGRPCSDVHIEDYANNIKKILDSFQQSNYEIIKATDIIDRSYTLDMLYLASNVPIHDLFNQGQQQLIHTDHTLGFIMYSIIQAIDQTVIDADVQIGNESQIPLFEFATKYLPQINRPNITYYVYNDDINIDNFIEICNYWGIPHSFDAIIEKINSYN